MLHSQLDTSLAFKCYFFYNWPEEIDVVGNIVTDNGDTIIIGTSMQVQYNYVSPKWTLFLENAFIHMSRPFALS